MNLSNQEYFRHCYIHSFKLSLLSGCCVKHKPLLNLKDFNTYGEISSFPKAQPSIFHKLQPHPYLNEGKTKQIRFTM